MGASYCRSLVLTPRRHNQNKLHRNKVDRLNWIEWISRCLLYACAAIFWTRGSYAQTSGPKTLEPTPRLEVSVAELKVPNKVWVHLQAAHRALSNRNLNEAAKQTDQALRIDSNCGAALAMEAFVDLAGKNPMDAINHATRAAAVDPSNTEALLALAMANNAVAHFTEAQRAAREALRLNPNSWEARLELAKTFYGEERFDAALAELDRASKDFPDVHLVRGNVLIRLGRSKEGAAEFAVFLQEAPHDSRVDAIRHLIDRTVMSPRF